jgi:hypothetical protein
MSPLLMAGRIPGGRSGTHQPGDGAGRLGPCHRRTRASAASLAYSLSPYTPRGYRKDGRGRPGREGPTGPRNKVRWPLPHTRVGHLRWGVAGDQVRSTGGGPDDERLRHKRLGLVVDDPGHARLLGASSHDPTRKRSWLSGWPAARSTPTSTASACKLSRSPPTGHDPRHPRSPSEILRVGSAAELGQELGPVGQLLLDHGAEHRLVDVPVHLVPVDAPERRVGSYWIATCTIRAVSSSVRRATRARAMSIPADTPAEVMNLPSSTHRLGKYVAPGVPAAGDRPSGWRPGGPPAAAARTSAPVQTDPTTGVVSAAAITLSGPSVAMGSSRSATTTGRYWSLNCRRLAKTCSGPTRSSSVSPG